MVPFFPRGARPVRALLALPFAAAAAAGALSACAAPVAGPANGPVEVRLMVKLLQPSQDRAVIAAEVSRVAGVPASYGSMVSSSWHALSLRCADPSTCDAAIGRLRQARGSFEAVELEGRKRGAVM
ncbi:MAG: hypothetical protein ABIQ06_12435 [Caldimonas sp.]